MEKVFGWWVSRCSNTKAPAADNIFQQVSVSTSKLYMCWSSGKQNRFDANRGNKSKDHAAASARWRSREARARLRISTTKGLPLTGPFKCKSIGSICAHTILHTNKGVVVVPLVIEDATERICTLSFPLLNKITLGTSIYTPTCERHHHHHHHHHQPPPTTNHHQ